ncbi:MAG: GlsB/YeaQ/YmgE family stress response membrane protein [Myxococcota bacterium]
MVNLVIWLILGLVAGALAKFIMPGKDPGGMFVTIGIGIAGSFLGGYLGGLLGIATQTGGLSLPSIGTAVAGALVLLAGYRVIKGQMG